MWKRIIAWFAGLWGNQSADGEAEQAQYALPQQRAFKMDEFNLIATPNAKSAAQAAHTLATAKRNRGQWHNATRRPKQRGYGEIEMILYVFGWCIILCVIVGGMFVLGWYECHVKYDRAGMADVTYGPVEGCMLKLPDGRWLPSDRIREVELPRK